MNSLTIVLPDWFLWVLCGYLWVKALTTVYQTYLNRMRFKLDLWKR